MKLAILTLLALAAPLAAQQHAFTVQDIQAMQRVMDPHVSPDGKWVAFTVRTTDLEANKSRADLWLAALDGSGSRQLTTDPANDADPRWLDAHTLVFMSTRGGSSQLWKLAIDGGEAQKLSDFPLDVENLNVIPGGRFLLSFNVWPKAKSLKESVELDAAQAKRKTSARVYDTLLERHWDSWEDGKRNHWFSWKPGEEPKDLMPGVDADAPTLPFGELSETAVSPDGKWVAFTQRVAGQQNAWHTNSDVFLVPADASAPPRNVSEQNLGYDNGPSFSPDGHTLAWLSMPRAGYEADRQQIVLMDVGSGSRHEVA
jgi:dipeptidyl aminopeptidase/acylaminoacyl peptidase